jgi:hypothetical protein
LVFVGISAATSGATSQIRAHGFDALRRIDAPLRLRGGDGVKAAARARRRPIGSSIRRARRGAPTVPFDAIADASPTAMGVGKDVKSGRFLYSESMIVDPLNRAGARGLGRVVES